LVAATPDSVAVVAAAAAAALAGLRDLIMRNTNITQVKAAAATHTLQNSSNGTEQLLLIRCIPL
jgi:hypothetical protein